MKIEKMWGFELDGMVIRLTEAQARELYTALAAEFGSAASVVEGRRMSSRWTGPQIERARQLQAEGYSASRIGAELGRTQGAVEQMFTRLRREGRVV